MNLLFSCIGKRGYIADFFRPHLRPGEQIVGTSHSAWTPGFRSCDRGLLLPPIASDEYVPALIESCTRYEIGGLLSFFDPDVMVLARHRDALTAAGVIPMIPDANAARICFDKWRTFETLRHAGVPVPDTTIDIDEARSGRFHFPLIVKPRDGYGSANVFVAHDIAQLESFFSYAPGMLIQEFVDGDAYDVDALAGLDNEVLHVVAWRKYLSRMGETEQAVTVEDPELIDIGRRLAETVGLVGPMDVDLFRTRDGAVQVIELNLRFGGGYPVSHLAGADFPAMIVDIFRGGHPDPRIGQYAPGVCMLKGLDVMGGPVDSFLRDLRSSTRST
jgi:carbamoyl-phosphate synthase large subunit